MIDQEERRKMAWQLVLSVARSGVNPDSEWSAKKAWEVVDSFLENEGGYETLRYDKSSDPHMKAILDAKEEVISERDALKAENEKLKEFKKGALADIFALTSKVSLQKEDYADLKAKLEEFKKTEIGSVMQEKLSLEFRCQGLEADLNRTKDELTAENEKLKEELDCVTIDAKGWQEHYRDAYDEIDELKADADHLTRQLDDAKLWAGRHESTERELREEIEKLTGDTIEAVKARIAKVKERDAKKEG